MRLIRHRRDFANPVSDSDRMNTLGCPKLFQTTVVISGAVPDTMPTPVEARERDEEEVRFDGRGGLERLGDPHSTQPNRLARPPESKRQLRAAADDDRQCRRVTVAHKCR